MVEIPKCACGCGAVIERGGRSGPLPTYASGACRVRAYRRRQATIELTPAGELTPDPGAAAPVPVRVNTARADDQVARSILEARAVGFAFARLGVEARPELAWRCAKLGTAILAALDSAFPETER